MPWIKRQKHRPHRCMTPDNLNTVLRGIVTAGDQWRCDPCGTVWTVHKTMSSAQPYAFRKDFT
ncbi:hypothetical protein [Amycolatopsis sp. cmx-11-32]|uniref:hypothetical protein n=1 Tax=Amycolatopsis sp. cmx-11-32 TaxID=2785796 RepID=UPI0039E3A6A0